MRMRLHHALLALLLLPGALVLAAQSSGQSADGCPTVVLSRTGSQGTAVNTDNASGTWNLTAAVWDRNAPDPIAYPIRSDHWTQGCIVGGAVRGDVPRDWTRDQWYNAQDGGTRLGGEAFRHTFTDLAGNYLVVRDGFASDIEDAFDPNGVRPDSLVRLEHVRAEWIRDDCVENEGGGLPEVPVSMVITGSLFDGCFTGLAERPEGASTAQNGTGAQFLDVENSLMYIKPQPLGPLYCSDAKVTQGRCLKTATPNVWLGAHGIWKWSTAAAGKVTVRNTIFRLDVASYSSCQSQKWPAGTYENVTLVWTGAGSYASAGDCTNVLPPGVTLTTDVSVWDDAKAAWLAGGSAPTATSSPTATPSPTSTSSPTASTSPTSTSTTAAPKCHGKDKPRCGG
jgi:hypothetical protein